MSNPRSYPVDERAVAQRDEDGVERLLEPTELDSDGSRSFGDLRQQAVLHVERAGSLRSCLGSGLGGVEVGPFQRYVGAKGAHAVDLQGVGRHCREHGEPVTPLPRRVCHALAEIPRRRAYQAGGLVLEAVQKVIGAATLERADRVDALDLEDRCHPEAVGERLAHVLRRVPENGIDRFRGFANSIDRDVRVHGADDKLSGAPSGASTTPARMRGGPKGRGRRTPPRG